MAPRIYFSHLYTGLDYAGFTDFLDLAPKEEDTETPLSPEKLSQLGEVRTWLFGDRKEGRLPVIKTQNPDSKAIRWTYQQLD